MVSSADGNVYLLPFSDHPRLYAVSPYGEVLEQFDISIPTTGVSATNMAITADGSILIEFGHIYGVSSGDLIPDGPRRVLAVVNTHTGEVSGLYRLPHEPEGISAAACATSADSFLFLGVTEDQQHQQIARYSAKN
jgi:hypothetical protein